MAGMCYSEGMKFSENFVRLLELGAYPVIIVNKAAVRLRDFQNVRPGTVIPVIGNVREAVQVIECGDMKTDCVAGWISEE